MLNRCQFWLFQKAVVHYKGQESLLVPSKVHFLQGTLRKMRRWAANQQE